MTTIDIESAPVSRRGGFYRRAILHALEPMRRGQLSVDLPDGSVEVIGDGESLAAGAFDGRASIRVRNERAFRRCFYYGDIGLAEGFIEADWETDDIARVISWFILNAESSPSQSASVDGRRGVEWLGWINRIAHRLRDNSLKGSRRNIADHYDLSNDFFGLFLDPTMTYSSAYFTDEAQSLESAQIEKYDRLCRKLRIGPSDHVLEIGGGWGAFSRYAASVYGCRVTSTTISSAQFDFASAKLKEERLEGQVELLHRDYRDLTGSYDKIVSIEMLESVGHRHLETHFAKCESLLKPEGLMGFQVIVCSDRRYDQLRKGVDFIQKYIFPGSLILSVGAINRAISRTGDFFLHDLEDMGNFYARTLSRWRETFVQKHDEVRRLGFDDRFIRIWEYYLSYCEASFAMRHNTVIQAVYSRPNNFAL